MSFDQHLSNISFVFNVLNWRASLKHCFLTHDEDKCVQFRCCSVFCRGHRSNYVLFLEITLEEESRSILPFSCPDGSISWQQIRALCVDMSIFEAPRKLIGGRSVCGWLGCWRSVCTFVCVFVCDVCSYDLAKQQILVCFTVAASVLLDIWQINDSFCWFFLLHICIQYTLTQPTQSPFLY